MALLFIKIGVVMIVISRQPDECVMIGEEVQIRVVEIEVERVKIQMLRDLLGRNEWLDVERELWMRSNEELLVGDAVIVTVLDMRGCKVRLGFAAPAQFEIQRKEIFDGLRG